MLLAVDVGNTNTSLGLFDGHKLKYQWRISTDRNRTSDETGMLFRSLFQSAGEDMKSIKDAIICSVVPPVMHSFTNAILKYAGKKPIIVGPGTKTGINIKYENPREVGADKIVNAVGAVKLYGAPVVIVDFGTATTYCAVNRNGDYLGGVICPGIKISAEALFDNAAKLPRVEFTEPRNVIGRNIVTSMQSGLFYGNVGQVEYLVKVIKREMGEENIKVIATGSAAMFIASKLECVDEVNPVLTLEGLREIYFMNITSSDNT
ncbi:MAG TPA: type III pantothenate kinase [Clostridia bacterium]